MRSYIMKQNEPSPHQIEIWRNMTPTKKSELIMNMYWQGRELKKAFFKLNHPDESDEQLEQRVREYLKSEPT